MTQPRESAGGRAGAGLLARGRDGLARGCGGVREGLELWGLVDSGRGLLEKANSGSPGQTRPGQPRLRTFGRLRRVWEDAGDPLPRHPFLLPPSFPPGPPREGAPGMARPGKRGGGGGGRGREGVRPEGRELLVRGKPLRSGEAGVWGSRGRSSQAPLKGGNLSSCRRPEEPAF